MNAIVSLLFVAFASAGDPALVFESRVPVVSFVDQDQPARALVVATETRTGEVRNLNNGSLRLQYRKVDAECVDPTLLYVHPVLANSKTSCVLDEESSHIRFMGMTEPTPYDLAFTYFSQDNAEVVFLLNGRSFPAGKAGYLAAKRIQKSGRSHRLQAVFGGLPQFSGGMAFDKNADLLYVTLNSGRGANTLYQVPGVRVRDALSDGTERAFLDVAARLHVFQGLSLRLLQGADGFLYDNGEYGAFLLASGTYAKRDLTLPSGCRLLTPSGTRWLLECGGKRILSAATEDL